MMVARIAREGTYSTCEGDILLTERELSLAVLQIKGSRDGTKKIKSKIKKFFTFSLSLSEDCLACSCTCPLMRILRSCERSGGPVLF